MCFCERIRACIHSERECEAPDLQRLQLFVLRKSERGEEPVHGVGREGEEELLLPAEASITHNAWAAGTPLLRAIAGV